MNVGFAGSRDYSNLEQVREAVQALKPGTVVVSGGARGVDRAAEVAARANDLPVISYRPINLGTNAWKHWGIERVVDFGSNHSAEVLAERYPSFAAAAFVRNGFIVEVSLLMHIFWDGHSRGTRDTLRKAQADLGPSGVYLHMEEA